jgi:hypothetical protein
MMGATIELERDVPDRTREILTALPGLTIRRGRANSTLQANGRSWPVTLVSGGFGSYATSTVPMLAAFAGGGLGFVVAERLPERARKELETAGCAYADDTGAAHIDVPGFYLHVEGRPGRRQTADPTPAGIGVVAVRTIQSLLAEPARQWSVADLARVTACSTGEAHRVLTRLQREGLITANGRARSLRRTVRAPSELLDWLATAPSARRMRERQYAFVYVSDPAKLASTISAHGLHAKLSMAFSGVAAAHLFGVKVTTAVPVTMLRIAPSVTLADAGSRLQVELVDSGPNVVLVRDLGEVGTHARQFNGPVPLAPPVRVWLDMLDEPRGEDAAALFRETVLGW